MKEKNVIEKEILKDKKTYIKKSILRKKVKNSRSFIVTDSVTDNGIIKLKTKEFVKVFSVQAIDVSLSSNDQLTAFFEQLKLLYQIEGLDLKIYKLDENINLSANKDYLKEMMKKYDGNIEKSEFLKERYELLESFENDKSCVFSNYYFAIISNNEEVLKKQMNEVSQICSNLNPKLLLFPLNNKYEIYYFLLNLYFGKVDLEKLLWSDLVELITPSNVIEKSNLMKIDDDEIMITSMTFVPPFVDKLFLEQIFNYPNTRCCLHVKDTVDNENITKVIDSSYQFLLSDRATTKRLSDATELDTLQESYQILMDELKNGNEKIKEVNLIIVITGNKKQREEIYQELKRLSSIYKIKLGVTRLRQYEAWQSYDISSNILKDYCVYLPSNTLSAGFPLTITSFNDEKGIMIGVDSHTALPVFFDIFHRSANRPSHNMAIVASTGGGKSFTLKKIITNSIMSGVKTFIFDCENEYKKLVKINHGEYINLFSKAGGIINPLQIRFLPSDREEKEDDITNCPLAKHMGFLESFYKCAFEEISEKELVILLEETEKLYESFGITKNSTVSMIENMKPTEFPIFSDLKKFIQKEKEEIIVTEKIKIIEQLDILLERFLVGTDSFLFNDYTNLDLYKSDLIAFNLQELIASDNRRLISTQLLNVLTFLNNAIVKNKIDNENIKNKNDLKHIMIIVDEFHLFIDEDNPEILKNLGQLARRLRKYSSSFICATQSVRDFIGTSSILRHATAIFNNCQYILTGMLKEDDLKAYLKLFEENPLTETQKNFLLKATQGRFLLNVTNNNRVRLWVLATPLERKLMGDEND